MGAGHDAGERQEERNRATHASSKDGTRDLLHGIHISRIGACVCVCLQVRICLLMIHPSLQSERRRGGG